VFFLISTWYVFSTTLTIYNKLILSREDNLLDRLGWDGGAFPAPLLLTGVQFVFQAIVSRLYILATRGNLASLDHSLTAFLRLILPNGVATGFDIGLSNVSLVFITTSFYTMCKSTSPIFLLLCAFALGLERFEYICLSI
jgi:solute carrier family 35, member C2